MERAPREVRDEALARWNGDYAKGSFEELREVQLRNAFAAGALRADMKLDPLDGASLAYQAGYVWRVKWNAKLERIAEDTVADVMSTYNAITAVQR